MKALKLKPLYLSNNEIFVKPPDFIQASEESQFSKHKDAVITDLINLKPHLAARKTKKDNSRKKKILETEEKEAVKKLSEWKRTVSPNSPLLRKYTFRRQLTHNSFDAKQKLRSSSHAVTHIDPARSELSKLVSKVIGIVAVERMKKKSVEEQTKRISKRHQEVEESIKASIFKIHFEVTELKKIIREYSEKLKITQDKLMNLEKDHENKLKTMKQQEVEELFFKDKGKMRKSLKQGEEGQYLMFKERMRHLKQEIHKEYQEDKERHQQELGNVEKTLELSQYERQKYKKQMKEYKEEIYNLYLRILKEGGDLRTEGLRWVLKAIWKLGQSVPISAFPKYIDEESILYLLTVSHKEMELEFCEKQIDNMRKQVKSRRNNFSISSSRELYKSIRSRLKEMSKSVISNPLDGKASPDTSNGDISLSRDPVCYSEIVGYRNKISQANEFIKENTEKEIKRVTDEYQVAPGDAESVGLFHLIKCLVGEKVREFNKYTRLQHGKARQSIIFS